MAARAGVEPTTLRLRVIASTNAPPCPTISLLITSLLMIKRNLCSLFIVLPLPMLLSLATLIHSIVLATCSHTADVCYYGCLLVCYYGCLLVCYYGCLLVLNSSKTKLIWLVTTY